MQGPMLLSLAFAPGLSSLAAGVETAAASLLVAGSAGIGGGDTANWLAGAGDAFAERPLGFYSQALGGMATGFGIMLLLIGVFRGL